MDQCVELALRAFLHIRAGNHEAASVDLKRFETVQQTNPTPLYDDQIRLGWGMLALAQGEAVAAAHRFDDLAQQPASQVSALERVQALLGLARCAQLQDDPATAREHLERAREILTGLPDFALAKYADAVGLDLAALEPG